MKRGSGNSKILPSPRRFSCQPSDAAIPTAGDVVAQGSPLGTRTRSHRALLGAGPSLGASTSDTKGPRGQPRGAPGWDAVEGVAGLTPCCSDSSRLALTQAALPALIRLLPCSCCVYRSPAQVWRCPPSPSVLSSIFTPSCPSRISLLSSFCVFLSFFSFLSHFQPIPQPSALYLLHST